MIWWFWRKPKKPAHSRGSAVTLNQTEVTEKWGEVTQLMQLAGPAHFRLAVIQADNLLDFCLKAKGVNGETMGERLKSARALFSAPVYDAVWRAHKLRNQVVHESEKKLMSGDAQQAINALKGALHELGVL